MLQINSGKLYQAGVGRTNKLRGVLYTNLAITGLDDVPLVTAAGTLLQTELRAGAKTLVYELTEQMDDGAVAPGVLISQGVLPYLYDFATVAAFFLEATCTPDADLCTRLLSGTRSLGVEAPPNKLIKRVFDPDVWLQPAERDAFPAFVDNLIGLKRKSFLAAMRAIRTFVTGLHRVADDVELAYTLLVASIESLAQGFDGHEGRWADFEEGKRKKIDGALVDADTVTAERVRQAIVEIEHLALARRFRDFALDHIDTSSEPATDRIGIPGRLDLRDALKEAYRLRSRYVHNLEDLPALLTRELNLSETIRHDHRNFLTLQGLAYHARQIILAFVERQPKVETEVYDYSGERYGVMRAQLAPEYWIGRPEALSPTAGRTWLEGLLQQTAAHLLSNTPITDLKAVVLKIEAWAPTLPKPARIPFEALYVLYNKFVGADLGSPNFIEIQAQFTPDLREPSIEGLYVYSNLEMVSPWSLDVQQSLVDTYFAQRNQRSGLRAPELYEAALILGLAEQYRAGGDEAAARATLRFAVENLPHSAVIRTAAEGFDAAVALDPFALLLPSRTSAPTPAPEREPEPPAGAEGASAPALLDNACAVPPLTSDGEAAAKDTPE